MRIEIDGSPIKKPAYAKSLSDGQFAEYVVNTVNFNPQRPSHLSSWYGGIIPHRAVDMNMLAKVTGDSKLPEHKTGIVKRGIGLEDGPALEAWRMVAAGIADDLADEGRGEYLELVPTQKSPSSGEIWVHRKGKEVVKDAFPIVPRVKRGMVVFRGNVDRVTGNWGNEATIYIDGDVNEIADNRAGVIYVRGDIHLLRDTGGEIIVAGGEIHNFSQGKYVSNWSKAVADFSPFIFAPVSVENQRANEFVLGKKEDSRQIVVADMIPSVYAIIDQMLSDWKPEETKQRALELCKLRLDDYFKEVKDLYVGLTSAEVLKYFTDHNVFGYKTGYGIGYHSAPSCGIDDD